MSYRSGPRDHEPSERTGEEQQLLHDLQVHQLELEMQNEELRRVQFELDASRLRYFELYDLAPVGYCTVGDDGLIIESNLAAAAMLGVDRGALKGKPFSRFIMPEDAGLFHLLRRDLEAGGLAQSRELRLRRADGSARWVRVSASEATGEGGSSLLRLVMSDVADHDLSDTPRMESGSAHDFDDLLTVILGNAEVALMDIDAAHPLYESLTEIRSATMRTAELMRRSPGIVGPQHLPPRMLDLEASVGERRPRGEQAILLVEDEPGLLRLLTRILEAQGYTVLAAATPSEALRLSAEHTGAIHLLLTDVVLTDTGGRDLAALLTANRKELRVLFMCGQPADLAARSDATEPGGTFIRKPFTYAAFATSVRRVLDEA